MLYTPATATLISQLATDVSGVYAVYDVYAVLCPPATVMYLVMLYHVIYIRYRVTDLKVSHRCMWS